MRTSSVVAVVQLLGVAVVRIVLRPAAATALLGLGLVLVVVVDLHEAGMGVVCTGCGLVAGLGVGGGAGRRREDALQLLGAHHVSTAQAVRTQSADRACKKYI